MKIIEMPSASDKVQDIFHSALGIDSAEQRLIFLEQACAEDTRLRIEVELLLKAYEQSGDFLEKCPEIPAAKLAETRSLNATQAPHQDDQSDFTFDEQLPRHVGDYELLQKIA